MKIIFLPLFLTTALSLTKDYRFEHITVKDGLSLSYVTSIAQDKNGYVWFGTQDGLNKYDGFSFVVYKHDPFDDGSIPSGDIIDILVDKKGKIWLGTDGGGLASFDTKKERCLRLEHKINDSLSLSNNSITSLYQDSEENIWVGTNYGLNKIDAATGKINIFLTKKDDSTTISNNRINDIIEDKENNMWVGTDNSLNKFFNGAFTRYEIDKEAPISAGPKAPEELLIDEHGELWIGDRGEGLYKYDRQTNSFKHFPYDSTVAEERGPRGSRVIALEDTKDGKLWLSTINNGIDIFDVETKTFNHIYPNPNNPSGLHDDRIYEILLDDNETIWMGGYTSGVHKLDRGKQKFSILEYNPSIKKSISSSSVRSVYLDSKDNIWLGLDYTGLDIINRKTQKRSTFNYRKTAEDSTSLRRYTPNEFLEDNRGNIWIAQGFLGLFYAQDSTFRYFKPNQKDSLKYNHNVRGILQLDNKSLLVAAGGYLSVFDLDERSYKSHRAHSPPDTTAQMLYFSKVIKDRKGNFWTIGNGLGKIDSDLNIIGSYFKDGGTESRSLSHNNTMSAREDKEGNIWVATYGGGLNKMEPENETIQIYTNNDGLANNFTYCALIDSNENIWLSTNTGISKFDQKGKTFKNFAMSDGLQSLEFNGPAYHQSKNGEIFLGGVDGLNYFYPAEIKNNPNTPNVVIQTFVKAGNLEIIDETRSNDDIRQVTYKEKHISFQFASIDYRDPSRNQHAYMMEGYDERWTYSGTRRYASYTNLPPGNYTFRAKGSNNDGVWNEEGASLKIKILPAPWETAWAYMLYFATTGFGIFGYVKRQRRLQAHAMEEQHREEELEEARQFQLDMLPKTTPDMLNLDISATIQTASEVGGDYYDFFPQGNGESLYVVVGDATGHGMTAGMMVSITKAGLYGIPPSIAPNDITKRLNRVIKNIDLGWNRMAINVARFWEDRVEFTSAAMPPVYHYHVDTGNVDEILLEGLPLGSLQGETFSLVEFEFKQGDSLVFISDGLPEAANHTENMLGYQAVQDCVEANGHQGANDQKQALLDLGSAWLGDLRNQDDITIVVVKKT
jgi:ligand-binding sensor domain-containing protein